MDQLPVALVSYLHTFLKCSEHFDLGATSRHMLNISRLASSTPPTITIHDYTFSLQEQKSIPCFFTRLNKIKVLKLHVANVAYWINILEKNCSTVEQLFISTTNKMSGLQLFTSLSHLTIYYSSILEEVDFPTSLVFISLHERLIYPYQDLFSKLGQVLPLLHTLELGYDTTIDELQQIGVYCTSLTFLKIRHIGKMCRIELGMFAMLTSLETDTIDITGISCIPTLASLTLNELKSVGKNSYFTSHYQNMKLLVSLCRLKTHLNDSNRPFKIRPTVVHCQMCRNTIYNDTLLTSGISQLTQLRYLNLEGSIIHNLSPLTSLFNLKYLGLVRVGPWPRCLNSWPLLPFLENLHLDRDLDDLSVHERLGLVLHFMRARFT